MGREEGCELLRQLWGIGTNSGDELFPLAVRQGGRLSEERGQPRLG